MSLTIQIVNYNSRDNLAVCLQSIKESAPRNMDLQIVVINNDQESLGSFSSDFGVDLIERNENIGFGRAHNLGSKAARGKYILLLNPDTKLFPGAISELVEAFSSAEKVGIVGSLLIGESGDVEEEHFGPVKTPLSLVGSKMFYSEKTISDSTEVDWVSGGAMMIRKNLFSELGGFDEGYFMYFEDVDLCLRAKKKGWKVFVNPKAKVFHKSGQSFSDDRQKKRYYYASQDYYLRKHFGLWRAVVARLLRFPFYVKNVWLG